METVNPITVIVTDDRLIGMPKDQTIWLAGWGNNCEAAIFADEGKIFLLNKDGCYEVENLDDLP